MTPRFASAALSTAALAGACLSAHAQQAPAAALPADQLEADYRVIAARCGTPAFEKSFYNQSRAAVTAGLVVKGRDPVQLEKTITSLRRSPFVLVTATSDCAAQMAVLKDVQKRRSEALHGARAGRPAAR